MQQPQLPPEKLSFDNDFGQGPIALGYFTDDSAQLAISYGLVGFIGFVVAGWPAAIYTAFLAANDCVYANHRAAEIRENARQSQTSELLRILGEDSPVAQPETLALPESAPSPWQSIPVPTDEFLTPDTPRLLDTLVDNPYQCRAIIAGQRTGKTYSAAVATYILSREDTRIYYINLQDHGQGNVAAFSHATKTAIGNLAALGQSEAAINLVADAIDIVKEFYAQPDAVLVVDEWASLGAETVAVPGLDTLWHELANKATALTSNGIGSGKAIWGIAPFFKAGSLRKDAKVLKLFAPLILSIAPGQAVPWTNPKNGKTSQIPYNAQVVSDAATNWDRGISEPADQQAIEWKRQNQSRIYWWNGQWHTIGPLPKLPQPRPVAPVASPSLPTVQPTTATAVMEAPPQIAQTVATQAVTSDIDAIYDHIEALLADTDAITARTIYRSAEAKRLGLNPSNAGDYMAALAEVSPGWEYVERPIGKTGHFSKILKRLS